MYNRKFSVAVILEVAAGIALSIFGLIIDDPFFMSVGLMSMAVGVVYHRQDGVDRKIEELHKIIDGLASKIR